MKVKVVPVRPIPGILPKNKWIDKEKLLESAERYGKSPYGVHLKAVAEGKVHY